MDLSADELKEVMQIFQSEANDQIKDLNQGLLDLEKNPTDASLLESLFRVAHSIKGASRMLGLTPIELISHELEEILGLIKNKKIEHKKIPFDLVYKGLDKIEFIVEYLANNKNPQINKLKIDSILADLYKFQGKKYEYQPEESDEIESITDEANKITHSSGKEHIRIPLEKIDNILNQTADLSSGKVNMFNILNEFSIYNEQFLKLYKELEKDNELYLTLLRLTSNDELGYAEINKQVSLKDIGYLLNKVFAFFKGSSSKLQNLYNNLQVDVIRQNHLINHVQEMVRDVRLLPISTIADLLPRMVRDISKQINKEVDLEVIGGDTRVDKQILEEIKDPIIHLVRNCIDHGIEAPDERIVSNKPKSGKISISTKYEGQNVIIKISDDGGGLDKERIIKKAISKNLYSEKEINRINEAEIYNLVFLSGFSTTDAVTDISGRGVGMDIVKRNIEKIKGVISLESVEGQGTTFTIKLPVSLSTLETLIFESYGEKYCIPIISVNRIVQIFPDDIELIGKKEFIVIDEQYIPIESLDDILNRPRRYQPDIVEIIDDRISQRRRNKVWFNVIVISSAEKKLAVIVDRLIDEQEIVIKSLGQEFKKMKYIMGITLLGSGDLTIILDPVDLLASTKNRHDEKSKILSDNNSHNYHVLVVDDSITTRTLEKNILEQAGFKVTIAYDGAMAWNILTESDKKFDLIISDVEMPIMTGHEFVNKVKKDDTYQMIPCILCTSLNSTEDVEKGYEAGADAYITKGDFNQQKLMEIILKLIGE